MFLRWKIAFSCRRDADAHEVFPGMWQHTYAQFKRPTFALLLPAHTARAPWIPFPICHPYEYLPLLAPTSSRMARPCWAELICCGESGNGGTPTRRLPAHSLCTRLCCDANSSGKRPEETYALQNWRISSFMFLCTPSDSHILIWTLSLHMWSIPSHFFKTYMCANSLDGDEGMRMCQHIKTLIIERLCRMQPKNNSKMSAWYSRMS